MKEMRFLTVRMRNTMNAAERKAIEGGIMKVGKVFCFLVMAVILVCGCTIDRCRRNVYVLSNMNGKFQISGKLSVDSDDRYAKSEYRFLCDSSSTVSNMWRFVESIPWKQRADFNWTISCGLETEMFSFVPGDDYDILAGSIPQEACCIIKVSAAGEVEESSCYHLDEIKTKALHYPLRRYYILPSQEISLSRICRLAKMIYNRHQGQPIELFVKPQHCQFRSLFCRGSDN